MRQNYKAVYFADFPADNASQKSITLAFGQKVFALYEEIKDFSSAEIRQLLGTDSYLELVHTAHLEELPINTYCLRTIKQSLNNIRKRQAQLGLPGMVSQEQLFDPVTVTFKGGAKEPFIRWYPYLEGYSPQFVRTIIERYAPDTKRILDPFAGTATTAFTASQLNKHAFFCEINPVLQFISLTKIAVRRLPAKHRLALAKALMEKGAELCELESFVPDQPLDSTYKSIFEGSQFFEETTYKHVLQLRTWIDRVAQTQPAYGAIERIPFGRRVPAA